MFHLVYCSTTTQPFSDDELGVLLTRSRNWNIAHGITGFLLYNPPSFIQILEGTESEVRKTFTRVLKDPRHHNIVPLIEETTDHREFADWSMAFRNLSNTSSLPEGYSEFLNTPFSGQEFREHPDRCQKLLLAFKKLL